VTRPRPVPAAWKRPQTGAGGAARDGRRDTLYVPFNASAGAGYAGLTPVITANGTSVTPSLVYVGTDVTASNWAASTYGTTLSKIENGTDVTLDQPTPLINAAGVQFNSGDYYQSPNTTLADVGTKDFVIEVVCYVRGTANSRV